MQEDVKTFSSGAQSSSSKAGYWMIPFVVLQAVARRFDLGALKYDAHNWKRGCEDAAFMRDRFNHLFEHLLKFKEGGDEEDDMEGSIVAVLINAVFLTYWTIVHRAAVEAAFPTQPSAQVTVNLPPPGLPIIQVLPKPVPLPELDVVGETRRVVMIQPTVAKQSQPAKVDQAPPDSKLRGQKPLPKDHGNSQFC